MPIPLSSIVDVDVSIENPGLSAVGFGIPLLLSNTGNAWGTPELVRSYGRSDFSADFASTTPEYQALTALFAQDSGLDEVMVGKGPTKPTQIKQLAISSVVINGVYKVNAYALGVLQQATYTAVPAAAWTTITAYATGFLLRADTDKLYICITAGTSSVASPPTGTGSDITDGTVHWMYAGVTGAAAGAQCNDAIAYNIMKALNALAAPDIAATSALSGSAGSKIVVTTGDAAGNWFALEPIASGDESKVSNLMALTDATTNPGVADDLDAILSQDDSWYALVLLFKSSAIVSTPSTGVSAWCAANERLLVVAVSDTACATATFSGGTDVLHTLTGQGSSYTAPQWHPRDYEFLDGCTDGYFLPLEPGSDNWRLKPLTGPTPVNLTPTQKTNLDARRAGYFTSVGSGSSNQNILAGMGGVENTTYGFIDTRRNIDWYRVNLQVDLVNLEIASNKLANTTTGRRKIATKIASRNDVGIQKGVISPDPLDPTNSQAPIMLPYTVTVPPVTDTSSYTASTRALTGVSTLWRLANPINSIAIRVNVLQ
jgi:hypothetical protein